MTDQEPERRPSWWRRRNWWKIGFFVMLVAFEIAREAAILASDDTTDPKIAAVASVSSFGGIVRATGRWTRIDGGERLVPSSTVIDCNQQRGDCIEATATVSGGYTGHPDLDVFPATFAKDAVTYENDIPACVRYSVRIDLALEKVLAVRQRKQGPLTDTCAKLEPRIEMTLGDGYQHTDRPFGDHFVPLVRLIAGLVKAL